MQLRAISSSGSVSTLAGTAGQQGRTDGTDSAAQFSGGDAATQRATAPMVAPRPE